MTALLAGLFLPMVRNSVLAQDGGDYELSWSTIDGGGGTSAGGSYTLTGTVGQTDAYWVSGGIYDLLGGFWPDVSSTGLYHPADTDSDNVISMLEILAYIDEWAKGNVTMLEVLEAIDLWAAGSYYWDPADGKLKPGVIP